jgi:hypothetical protein
MKLLALVIIFIILLILVEWYDKDDSRVIERLSYDAERVVPGITKRCTILSGSSTYTENKNKIYILLREPSGRYYDYNTLVYALLHEVSHVLTPELNHTKIFIAVYSNLLSRAYELGIYKPGEVNMDYCKQCVV